MGAHRPMRCYEGCVRELGLDFAGAKASRYALVSMTETLRGAAARAHALTDTQQTRPEGSRLDTMVVLGKYHKYKCNLSLVGMQGLNDFL